MIRHRRKPSSPLHDEGPSEGEIARIRLASTLVEERRLHAIQVARLERVVEGLKGKLKAAHERLAAKEGRWGT